MNLNQLMINVRLYVVMTVCLDSNYTAVQGKKLPAWA